MATNTPRLSLRDQYDQQNNQQYDQFVQRLFDEVSSERDAVIGRLNATIGRLNTTIAENTRLKNVNAGCWHIIATKQNEIDALHSKHPQPQRELDRERQQIENMTDIGLEEATHEGDDDQHDTASAATTKHHEVIIVDEDYQNDDVPTSEDATAELETDVQGVDSDSTEVRQPAPEKKRKRKTKPVVIETSASKRSRRKPKLIQVVEVVIDQADRALPIFSLRGSEIVGEDGKALPDEVQVEFKQQMADFSNHPGCPGGDWRLVKTSKDSCVKCQIYNSSSTWTIKAPRRYACRTCANTNSFCVKWNGEMSKYLILPLPPAFAAQGSLQFRSGTGKYLSRLVEGKKWWPRQ